MIKRRALLALACLMIVTSGQTCPRGPMDGIVAQDVISMSVTPSTGRCVPSNQPTQLRVHGELADGTKVRLTTAIGIMYTSSDESIAAVSPTGLITPRSNGTVTISVIYNDLLAETQLRFDDDDDADGIANCGEVCDNAPPETVDDQMTDTERTLARDVFDAMNAARSKNGLESLVWHPAAARIAYLHATAMDDDNFVSHVNPVTGEDQSTRAYKAGIDNDPDGRIYPDTGIPYVGEVIYSGIHAELTGTHVVDALLSSPSHRSQILAPTAVTGQQVMPAWTHCGVGIRIDGDHVWVTAMFFKNPSCKL